MTRPTDDLSRRRTSTGRRTLLAVALLAGALAIATACNGDGSSDECSSADDCPDNQVCRSGSCVTPDDPDGGLEDTGMDTTSDPDTEAPSDDGGTDGSDGGEQDDELTIDSVTLDDGSTALTFGIDTTEGRGDFIPDIEVTSDAVYALLHSEGDPLTGNTIFEHRAFLLKFNRSDRSLAWINTIEPQPCETEPYALELADDGTIFTLSDYREACSEGVNVAVSSPLYVSYNPDGSVVDRDFRTDPNYCYRAMDLAPDASSMIAGGQSNCRQDQLAQYPLFGRITSDLSSQTPRELSNSNVGTGWIVDLHTLDSGTTFGAGYIPPESDNDGPQPFFSSLNADNSTGDTATYSSSGIEPAALAVNADNLYIAGTNVSNESQAVLLPIVRDSGSFENPVPLGNSPSEGKDTLRGPNGDIWVLSNPVDGESIRIDALTPGNLSSPTTSTIDFTGTDADTVVPQSLALDAQSNAIIGGSWTRSSDNSAQAFVRFPASSGE